MHYKDLFLINIIYQTSFIDFNKVLLQNITDCFSIIDLILT